MRTLGIGSGHPGAASGVVKSDTREQMEKRRAETFAEIERLWKEQKRSGKENND
jgi:hypothetical protein